MRKSMVLFAALLVTSAQTASLDNLLINNYSDTPIDSYEAEFRISVPAQFPKPATSDNLIFSCRKGFDADFIDKAKLYNIKFSSNKSMQFGDLKVSCSNMKIKVSRPNLYKMWTSKSNKPDDILEDVTSDYGPPADIRLTANKQALAIQFGGLSAALFSLKDNKIKVIDSRSSGAIAFSQGGKAQPLWVSDGISKTLLLNVKKPFTIHYTYDGGNSWDNITIDLAGNTLTRWGSLKTAGVEPPKYDEE